MIASEPVTFTAGRSSVAGTLVRPAGTDAPPTVVMAHGFAARRTWGLPAFAERFAEAGVAALTFDYRGFGDSGGGPRRVISAERQREDVRAAVAFAREHEDLGDGVGLWGLSYGGGHAIAVAADADVRAVVATVPFTDGRAAGLHFLETAGLGSATDAALAALRDLGAAALGRDPHYVPVVSEDGEEFAVLSTPGAFEGFAAMIPEDERESWHNRTAARVFLEVPCNRPIAVADRVDAPVFVVQATDDRVVPPGTIDRLVARLDDVHRVRFPMGHFDVLAGPAADEVAERQARFLASHLG